MNNKYILTHGNNGCNIGYKEIRDISESVIKEYHYSSTYFWMWKMFQFGFAYGKRAVQEKRRAAV